MASIAIVFRQEYAEVAQRASDMMSGSPVTTTPAGLVKITVPLTQFERFLDAVAA